MGAAMKNLHNFKTHREAWRDALERMIKRSADDDNHSYWVHELKAYDDAMKSFDEYCLKVKLEL